jgi:hypothetical protein
MGFEFCRSGPFVKKFIYLKIKKGLSPPFLAQITPGLSLVELNGIEPSTS